MASNLSLRDGEALTSEQGVALLMDMVSTGQVMVSPFVSKAGNPGWSFQHRPVAVGIDGVAARMSGFITLTKKGSTARGPVTLSFGSKVETREQRKARRAKHSL